MREKISELFESNNIENERLAQKMCHALRMDYYIGHFKKNGVFIFLGRPKANKYYRLSLSPDISSNSKVKKVCMRREK